MIKFIYNIFGKSYRKINIYLSFFYLGKYKLKNSKINVHKKIFKQIIQDKKKITSEKISKKNLFTSFARFKIKIREIIFNEYKLKKFLSEDEIHKVMCGLNRLIFFKELRALQKNKNWLTHWSKIIKEENVGNPIPFFIYPKSSGNRIHETFNIMKLSQFNNFNKHIDNVIEFGGGYGGFCNLHKKLFKVKKYIIYDLLEVSYIQFYYLKMLGYNVKINSTNLSNKNCIYLFSEIKILNKFLKNFNFKKSIFMSNWGFSETPIFLRKKFEKYILKSNEVYFAFQQKFGNIDNYTYFNSLLRKRNNIIDTYSRMNENHFYLFSKKIKKS